MNNKEGKVIYKNLSYCIVGVLFDVYNELGFGYNEKTYEMAIAKKFDDKTVFYQRQASYILKYGDEVVGRNYIDFVIEDKIILEIKRGDYFSRKNIEQMKRYMKTTKMRLGILAHLTSKGVKTFRVLNDY